MRVLFDHNLPAPLRRYLRQHDIVLAADLGWQNMTNGALLSAAEVEGIHVVLTADRNLRYQQNLAGRRVGVVVLSTQSLAVLIDHIPDVENAIEQAGPGSLIELDLPRPPLHRRPPPVRP